MGNEQENARTRESALNDLLACPFCNGTAVVMFEYGKIVNTTHHETYQKHKTWWVKCDDCQVSQYHFDNKTKAIESWNTRSGNVCITKHTENKINQIISEQLQVEMGKVRPQAQIIDDLGADSLDVCELIMAFEQSFDVDIDDATASKLTTVGKIYEHASELNI